MQPDTAVDQAEIIDFLSKAESYAGRPAAVARYETHGAVVFAAGDDVYKIKRAIRFPYMDFSTLALRERVIRREHAINAPSAPELYRGVVPITRDAHGRLAVGGGGAPVEWALHMRRFRDEDLLSAVVQRGGLDRALALGIADAVAEAHARAPVVVSADGASRIGRVVAQVADGLAAERHAFLADDAARFRDAGLRMLDRLRPLLDVRASTGTVRRCHGDLHLGNIVLWCSRPVLFDALEFSEELATVDTLYDLAFLLMDLDRSGSRRGANLVLNRYLLRPGGGADVDGLAALPLFLAVRAAVRAMVGAERAGQEEGARRTADIAAARRYLSLAFGYLSPPPPRLIAVGGLSGTGKSTLAAALAPATGAAPGALHIRADVERKALEGVDESVRLPAEAYTAEAAARVYAATLDKARRAIAAGHSAVVDAVFSRPEERRAAANVAAAAGIGLDGLWLTAPAHVMIERVGRRVADASDATEEIVARQLDRGAGEIEWQMIDAGGTPEATLAAATDALAAGRDNEPEGHHAA